MLAILTCTIWWPTFGNTDSPLFLSDCRLSQHWINHESRPVSYLCVNT